MQRTYTGIPWWTDSPSFERMVTQRVMPSWWWLPAFIAAAFVLYWPVLHLTPFSDDHSALWNSGVRGIPWRNGIFRPLSDLTFRIGYLLGGTAVEGHRAFNITVHAVNAYLLFILFRQWSPERAWSTGLLSGALFLVYPFHQESVVWLVGRESSLGTLSVLLGAVIGGLAWNEGLRSLSLTVILVLGLLCYESALLLIPIAFIAARSRITERWSEMRPVLLILTGVGVLYIAIRAWHADANDYIIGTLVQHPIHLLANVPKVLARLFLPPAVDPSIQLLRGAVLAAAILSGFIWWLRKESSKIARQHIVVWCLLIVTACTIGYIAGVSTTTSESDRFLYMPSAFLCGLLGMVVPMINSRILSHGTALVLVMGSVILMKQNHANWMEASRITRLCLAELPPAPQRGTLWVYGLPDDHHGAFIFRNGFPEALALAGGRADEVVVVPSQVGADGTMTSGFIHRGLVRHLQPNDLVVVWRDSMYAELDQH
jgi:hypothetical protein